MGAHGGPMGGPWWAHGGPWGPMGGPGGAQGGPLGARILSKFVQNRSGSPPTKVIDNFWPHDGEKKLENLNGSLRRPPGTDLGRFGVGFGLILIVFWSSCSRMLVDF